MSHAGSVCPGRARGPNPRADACQCPGSRGPPGILPREPPRARAVCSGPESWAWSRRPPGTLPRDSRPGATSQFRRAVCSGPRPESQNVGRLDLVTVWNAAPAELLGSEVSEPGLGASGRLKVLRSANRIAAAAAAAAHVLRTCEVKCNLNAALVAN